MRNMEFKIINGDSFEILKQQPDNSFDSVVTDPPYGLGFMGKEWDKPENIAFNHEFWAEVLRVLKPGGHLLAFSGSRTYHRMAIAIEDAGFEIRDQIMWLYGVGFPKSSNIGKKLAQQWEGWGSALKPAHEPIVMARKPFKGTLVNNVLENGVGGLNIDDSRIQHNEKVTRDVYNNPSWKNTSTNGQGSQDDKADQLGRFPANVIHDGSDEVVNAFPNETQRFFYGSKCSKADRSEGLDENQINTGEFKGGKVLEEYRNQATKNDGLLVNNHPTVKPTDLMAYLVRLVTPQGGKVLDPFNGSGSTGKAVAYLNKTENKNYSYIGMELDPEYVKISQARIQYTMNNETWLEKKK